MSSLTTTHSRPHLVLALAAVSALLFFCGASAETGELIWRAPGIENVVSMEAIEDIDGDGGPDIVFESYDAGAGTADHLYCIRGASSGTGEVIWSTRPTGGPSSSGGYGENCVRIAPDITGDGVQDVLLGTAWGGRSAYVLDGTNGDNVHWMFDTYVMSPPSPPTSGWVYGIDAVADVTGDDIPDVVFCVGSDNDGVYMMDGASGSVLWYYHGGDAFFDVRYVGDVNGDDIADVVAASGDNYPGVYCFSGPGSGGMPSLHWQQPYPAGASIMSIQPLQSIDWDPYPEVVVASWDGRVHCHDGESGTEIWVSPPLAVVVQRISIVGDVNDDGIEDIVAGLWTNKAVVISGVDGSVIWQQWVGTLNGGDTWAVDGAGDVNFDGVPDVAVGSFDTKIYLMDGVDGTILWDYPTGNRVFCVRGVPDLNGNGIPDVVGGTQRLTTGGWVYAIEGLPPSMGVGEPPAGEFPIADLMPGDLLAYPTPLRIGAEPLFWALTPPSQGDLRLEVIAADGRLVSVLRDGPAASGEALRGTWNQRDRHGAPVNAGVFWVRARLDGRTLDAQRLIVVR